MTSTSSLYFPGQFLNWLYETEYNRSFCKKNSFLNKESLIRDTSAFNENLSGPLVLNTTCSVAVQTDNREQPRKGILKQIQTDFEDQSRKSILKKESGIQTSINEERKTNNKVGQNENHAKEKKNDIRHKNLVKEKGYKLEKPRHRSDTYDGIEKGNNNERSSERNGRYYARILDVVAGMNSSSYHRSPFIQSKKRIKHKGDAVNLSSCFNDKTLRDIVALQNEPAFQKKRISCYSKNHNILRTNTVEEPVKEQNDLPSREKPNEDMDVIQEKIPNLSLMRYQDYRPKSTQGFYRTTYDDEFQYETSLIEPPLLAAEKRLKMKERLWKMRRSSTSDLTKEDSNCRKDYDKDRYQTEYNGRYQWNLLGGDNKKDIKKHYTDISKDVNARRHQDEDVRRDEEFYDYYDQVLQNRIIAYQPVLENYAQMYSSKNRKNESKDVSTRSGRPLYDPKKYTNDDA